MLKKKYYANGQKIHDLNGNILTFYFKYGKLKAEGLYINEQMEGEWKFYRGSGQLWVVGNFKSGKKNGSWIRYNKNGLLEYKEYFENNTVIKQK